MKRLPDGGIIPDVKESTRKKTVEKWRNFRENPELENESILTNEYRQQKVPFF